MNKYGFLPSTLSQWEVISQELSYSWKAFKQQASLDVLDT